MTEEIQHIKKQIKKEMNRLRNLYNKLDRLERKRSEPEERRVKRLELQLKKKYPGIKIDRSLLRLVGVLPRSTRSKDKEVIRAIIAERYAKR